MAFIAGDEFVEPCFGEAEFAAYGSDGDAEGFGGLFDAESAEVTEFDDFRFTGVEFGEIGEGVVEGDEFLGALFGVLEAGVEGEPGFAASALGGGTGTGVIDKDLAHELGGDSEEMGAAAPFGHILIDQPHVGFMDEGGGLERVIGAFAAEVAEGELAQFAVDDGG